MLIIDQNTASTFKLNGSLKSTILALGTALALATPLCFSNANAALNEAVNLPSSETAWQKYTVQKGDNLTVIFTRLGLSIKDALEVSKATQKEKTFVRLIPGEKMNFLIEDKKLQKIHYQISKDTVKVIERSSDINNYALSTQKITDKTESKSIISQPQEATTLPVDSAATNSTSIASQSEAEKEQVPLNDVLAQSGDLTDNWVYYTVKPNDNLSAIFMRAGLSHSDVAYVSQASDTHSFNNIRVGEKIGFVIRANHLVKVNYIISQMKNVVYTRESNTKYDVEVFEKKPITEYRQVAGNINNSFFIDALNAGLSNNIAMNFTKVFGWDVDFSQDVKSGDSFKVVYEELTVDGTKVKNGNIVAAEFQVGGQKLTGIFFKDSQGQPGFYTPDGQSMRKAFLRMPVEFARISSKFNLRRKHPIWNTIRAHRGVDYAAKTGTPIMAAGKGKIIYQGRRGDYGKTIIIQHGSGIETLYAHMSGYNNSLKTGSKVSQGQVIGYVGATGKVTGAHLHYEFRVDGVHKNPLTVKLTKPVGLDPEEMPAFKQVAQQALQKLHFEKEEKIASNPLDTNI